MTDKFNDELLSAYIDGELSGDELAYVEQLLHTDAEAAATVDELRMIHDGMQELPRMSLKSEFPRRLIHRATSSASVASAKDRNGHRGNGPSNTSTSRVSTAGHNTAWIVGVALASAASLALAILVGWHAQTDPNPRPRDVVVENKNDVVSPANESLLPHHRHTVDPLKDSNPPIDPLPPVRVASDDPRIPESKPPNSNLEQNPPPEQIVDSPMRIDMPRQDYPAELVAMLDENDDGVVVDQEAHRSVARLLRVANNRQKTKLGELLLATFDRDENSSLSRIEADSAVAALRATSGTGKSVAELFIKLDENNDLRVTIGEIETQAETLGGFGRVVRSKAKVLVDQLDADHDGAISFVEAQLHASAFANQIGLR